ncbi:MAG: TetR/AcrR family transcriptional regulator [Burkholderiales bacterium]|nr:TetR/AcrR family transcriptional regulator [Burkholderiales bacterium]
MEPLISVPTPPNQRRYGGVLPEERQRQRHAKLIEGAVEVFGTKGFHASTVREVCVAAHLTERYFYESFKTLPELFLVVYAELREQLMALTLKALDQADPTPLGLLEPAMRVFLEFIRDDPRRGRIMLVDALGVDNKVAAVSGATARDYSDLLKLHLGRMVPEALTGDVSLHLLADGMIGMNVLLAARWMQDGFVEPIDKVLRTNLLPYQALVALADASRG